MNKKTQDVLFSSKNMEEVTPEDFYQQLNTEFKFTLDLAADASNTKCEWYYDEQADALEQTWKGRCWCNPPYGRTIHHWTCKAEDEAGSIHKPLIVMLLPARTDTKWFEVCARSADEIRFVKGRLKFGDNKHVAPFPSMLSIWNSTHHKRGPILYEPYSYNLIWRR